MNAEFNVHLLSSERSFYEGPCTSLILPSLDGQLGIMAHHSSMVAAVVPGMLTCRLPDGTTLQAVVSNGLVRVEHNDVLLLADTLERPEEIDENRARRAAEQAREAMLQQRSQQEYLQAQADLSRAQSRLKAASLRNKTI